MADIAKRATAVVGRAVANTVSAAVTALMTAAGISTGHPELLPAAVPVGALAGSLTDEGLALVEKAIFEKAHRVGRFVEAAEQAANMPIEELINAANADPAVRELLTRTVQASASAHDNWKIDMLAKAFAHGAVDGDVDEMLLAVEILRQMEAPHARLMRVLDRPDGMEEHDVATVAPAFADVLPVLVHKLARLELVQRHHPHKGDERLALLELTPLGNYYAGLLSRLGDRPADGGWP